MGDDPLLAAAVEADLVAHVSLLYEPIGAVHRDQGVWFMTGDRSPYRNGVLRAPASGQSVDELVRGLLTPFLERDLPMMWWVFTPPERRVAAVDRSLRRNGLVLDSDLPGMTVDLAIVREPALPSDASVLRVVDEEIFGAWGDVVSRAFDDAGFASGPSARAFAAHGFGDEAPFRHFVCRAEGEWVGASTLSLGAGVAGLANIAVIPERRGRGIGAAVAAAALLEGRDLGLRIGTLSAGELGLPLYRRLGFREVSRHRTYVWQPAASTTRLP
jgi:ribosomal protein S18 acetylase RimI-like enzyme